MPEEKTKQAGWAYTFLYPNAAAKYNEEQRKLKRKGDDIKLHKMYKLIFDIEKREFLEACRTVLNDRERAKIKSTEEYLPLHLAIYARAPLQLLEILIEAYPAALQQRDPQSLLCIHIAVRDNTVLLPILRTLVQCFPACLRELDPAGDLPIHSALRNRLPKEAIIELLDFHPESLHVCDSQNNTLLHMALRFNGHDELIENLVKRKPEMLRAKNTPGDLPFHRACLFHASPTVLQLLLSLYPESVRVADAQGNLPIHLYYMQCRGGRPSEHMLHFFLEPFPASVGMLNRAGCTPFQVLDNYYEQLEAYNY